MTDDLRDRIARQLAATWPIDPHLNAEANRTKLLGITDAVMAAVRPEIERAEDRLRQIAASVERSSARAADAEAARDRWQKRGEQAEAAIERVRDLCARMRSHPDSRKWADHIETALDQPEETP